MGYVPVAFALQFMNLLIQGKMRNYYNTSGLPGTQYILNSAMNLLI